MVKLEKGIAEITMIEEAIQVFFDNKLSGRITLHIKEGELRQIEKTDFTHI